MRESEHSKLLGIPKSIKTLAPTLKSKSNIRLQKNQNKITNIFVPRWLRSHTFCHAKHLPPCYYLFNLSIPIIHSDPNWSEHLNCWFNLKLHPFWFCFVIGLSPPFLNSLWLNPILCFFVRRWIVTHSRLEWFSTSVLVSQFTVIWVWAIQGFNVTFKVI